MEFVAANPGDWMIHCHLPHHMMNAMASTVPPLSGTATGTAEQPVSPLVGPAGDPMAEMHAHHHHQGGGSAPDARSVPGYPQDMFMAMDQEVARPETHGLREGWTGGMMGMMTLLRVLSPERYEEILALKEVRGKVAPGGGR